jgi:hypothetical protein
MSSTATMAWAEIIKFVGGGTAFLTVSAWFIRSLMQQLLSRDLERFRSDLRLSGEREIESLKSLLSIEATKEQIRFSKLQERRADVIAEAYKKLVALNSAGMVLTCDPLDNDDEDLRRKADEFIDRFFEFRSFVEECAIYFPEETVRVAMKLGDLIFNLSLEIRYHSTPADVKRLIQKYKAAEKDIETSNKQIRQYIESEFRKMLGASS